jgi:(2R)-sulfolactate sulfo-lyase subunit beta
MDLFNRYAEMIDCYKTDDLSGSLTNKGNIAGGLITIEDKALGNIQKIGKKCKYVGALDKAAIPTRPGLWYMDSSSAAAETAILWRRLAFSPFFPTDQGNIIGNLIEPVLSSPPIRQLPAICPSTSIMTALGTSQRRD